VKAIGVAVTKLVKEEAIFASGAFCNNNVDEANIVVVVLEPEEGTIVNNEAVVVFAFVTLSAVAEDTKLAVPFKVISTPVSLRISAIILPMPC
jgi:hypothetical protein